MKLNLASGAHPLDGFENLDRDGLLLGRTVTWTFESGLPYEDESIEAITESHGLMYVALADWPFVFSEFARVLAPNGVVRITEDATDDPHSDRFGGFHDAVTLTSVDLVTMHLHQAGLLASVMPSGISQFTDLSLCQAWHGREPKVFFIEGVKA